MLKIRDNVDLDVLKSLGFKNKADLFWKPKRGEWSVIEVKIDSKTRIISISPMHDSFHTVEDTLFDLIISGLVEKIDY